MIGSPTVNSLSPGREAPLGRRDADDVGPRQVEGRRLGELGEQVPGQDQGRGAQLGDERQLRRLLGHDHLRRAVGRLDPVGEQRRAVVGVGVHDLDGVRVERTRVVDVELERVGVGHEVAVVGALGQEEADLDAGRDLGRDLALVRREEGRVRQHHGVVDVDRLAVGVVEVEVAALRPVDHRLLDRQAPRPAGRPACPAAPGPAAVARKRRGEAGVQASAVIGSSGRISLVRQSRSRRGGEPGGSGPDPPKIAQRPLAAPVKCLAVDA
jgi:hypothetical protein